MRGVIPLLRHFKFINSSCTTLCRRFLSDNSGGSHDRGSHDKGSHTRGSHTRGSHDGYNRVELNNRGSHDCYNRVELNTRGSFDAHGYRDSPQQQTPPGRRRRHDKIQYPEKSPHPKQHLYSPEEHNAYRVAMAHLRSKMRRDVGLFVENRRMIKDLLNLGNKPSYVFYVQEEVLKELPNLPDSTATIQITEIQMAKLTDVVTHQGIMAVFDRPSPLNFPNDRECIPLIVYMDQVADPGNAGTIIRSAAGAACTSVIASKNTVNVWKPALLRAAAAAHFLIPIHQNIEFEDVISTLPTDWTICFVESQGQQFPKGCPSVPYHEADFTGPTLMVFGNESRGVSRGVKEGVSETHNVINTFIPTVAALDSLNVGMVATVLIYEMAKQQLQIPKKSSEYAKSLFEGFSDFSLNEQPTTPASVKDELSDVIERLDKMFPPAEEIEENSPT